MKKSVLGFVAIAITVGGIASARSIMQELEPVTVKSVVLSGDFMPPTPPGLRPLTTLKVQVNSSGCTDAKSFRVDVGASARGKTLRLVRVKADPCDQYLPEGEEIELTTDQVGLGEQVHIANPLRVTDNTTH